MPVRITTLPVRSDARGASYAVELPFGGIAECHVATIRPGMIRGNHFHITRREMLVVLHRDRWTLFWDDGEGTPVQSRSFEGNGAVLMEADPLEAHAVRNDGAAELQIFVLGDRREEARHERLLATPLTRIAGVDGYSRGWVAVIKDGEAIESAVCATDEELLDLVTKCLVVAVDIPIGLSDRGPRLCDHHARRLLGRRASCVFPAPIRPLIGLADYGEANRVSRQLQQRGISKQGFAIVPKIAQIDRLLQRHHALRGRVHEVHPEVSFAIWNEGVPVEPSKHTREGLAARRKLATTHFGDLPPVPRGVREQDLLDACAALWTAERIAAGRARQLGDARSDVTGLAMKIVY